MGLFGFKAPQTEQYAQGLNDRFAPPHGDMQQAIAQAPRKKGLFGNAFRPDSPLWHILGGAGDVITGEPVYTQGLMDRGAMRQKSLMDQAQAEAENAQWYERERWKRDNPERRVNDTEADYEYRKRVLGEQSANDWLRSAGDPPVTMTLPNGQVYSGPRSGLGAALGSGQPAPRRLGPIVDQIPGGQPGGTIPFAPSGVNRAGVTSTYRTPEHNRKVGGVPNSYHTRRGPNGEAQAIDSVPPQGMSMAEYYARLKAANPRYDVINEGDHVHIEPRGR
jgi:hypothetical protein